MNTSSSKKPFACASLVLALVVFPACESSDGPIRGDCPDCKPTIVTASIYCGDQGGHTDYRADAGVYCKFDDGSECEAWAFYRRECKPGDCASWETCKPGVDSGATSDNGCTGCMPNPASVNCTEKGGTLEIRTNAAGEYGVCKFGDGSECEEWAFFRGECKPGDSST